MLSGSEAPHGSHPAGPALAQRRARPQPARGAPYPKILARRAWGPQPRGKAAARRSRHHLPELGGVLGAVGVFAGMRVALAEFL